jgi:hypothetical protein
MAVPPGYKTLTCYLPPELAEQLKAYCFKHEITRKNKQGELSPSWGTGIVEALKLFFSSDNVPSPLPNSVLEKKMVEDMVKDSLNSLFPSNVLTTDSPIVKELDKRLSQLEASRNEQESKDNHEVTKSSSEGEGETTKAISESGETQRFTDRQVQAILKQKYNIRTTPQTVNKWRNKITKPLGRNKLIFDLFKPDGDRWIRFK